MSTSTKKEKSAWELYDEGTDYQFECEEIPPGPWSSYSLIHDAKHINLKSMKSLKELTASYFKHVFMFGMNDEVLHTGHAPMCHYIWSLGAEKKW